jgi:RecA/RadA recombinase
VEDDLMSEAIALTDATFDKVVDDLAKKLEMVPVNLQRGTFVENSLASGALSLDLALGGGWPGGRWSVVFGPEAGGKSTLSFYAMAAAVRQSVPVFHFDPEGAADPSYMQRIGLKTNWQAEQAAGSRVFYRYYQPDYGEQVFRLISRILKMMPDASAKDGIQAMFAIDSLPFLQPQRRFEDDEAGPMAQQAKMYADNIPLIKSHLAAKNCVLYAVNQIRLRPGTPRGQSPEYEPCGETPKHASDLRLRVNRRSVPSGKGGAIEEETCWDGHGKDRYVYAILRTIKNKMFSPFRETWMRIWFEEKGMPGRGIDPVYDTYQYLTMTNQLEERAGFYRITLDGYSGTGRLSWDQFKALVLDDAARRTEGTNIRAMCRRQFRTGEAFERYFGASGGSLGLRAGFDIDAEAEVVDLPAKVEPAQAAQQEAPPEPKRRGRPPKKAAPEPEASPEPKPKAKSGGLAGRSASFMPTEDAGPEDSGE